jgi:hypothetical protein
MASFFNLPPPWNPGYTDPGNVDAEGLERGTFVTKQLPRGTYDQPAVGTGGYQVPGYIRDEGYGQGAMVTKQMDRGQAVILPPNWLDIPTSRVKSITPVRGGTRYGLQVLSGMPSVEQLPEPGGPNDPISNYGKQAARMIVTRMRAVPATDRKTAMKALLDAVDPQLWTKVAEKSSKYLAAGRSDLSALEESLASCISEGMLRELIATGKTGKAPPAKSQLGLGCYGCTEAILGDVIESLSGTAAADMPFGDEKVIVGPFEFLAANTAQVWPLSVRGNPISDKWRKHFFEEVTRLNRPPYTLNESDRVQAHTLGVNKWSGADGRTIIVKDAWTGKIPVYKSTHPHTGKDWGIYYAVTPVSIDIHWKEIPPEKKKGFGAIWNSITSLPSTIHRLSVKATKEVIKGIQEIGGMACDLLKTPGIEYAAAAGAAAYGVPPTAGVAGVDAGRGMCNKPVATAPPPIAPPPKKSQIGLLPAIAIIGGSAAAAFYFTKKK